ncbi:MAG: hypothetical protein ACI89X_001940 [Planctomycetota bacterium]|jgi:hypothetical protein
MVQDVQLEVRDGDGEVLILKPHLASLTELSELYVVLPEGRFAVRATTKSGLVAEREIGVDATVPARRAILLQLRKPQRTAPSLRKSLWLTSDAALNGDGLQSHQSKRQVRAEPIPQVRASTDTEVGDRLGVATVLLE